MKSWKEHIKTIDINIHIEKGIKTIQIEPYAEEDDSEESSGVVDDINLAISTLDKSIDFFTKDRGKKYQQKRVSGP